MVQPYYSSGANSATGVSTISLAKRLFGGVLLKFSAINGTLVGTNWNISTGDMSDSQDNNPNAKLMQPSVYVSGPAVDPSSGATVTYAQQFGPALVRLNAVSGAPVFSWNSSVVLDLTTSTLLAPWPAYQWAATGYVFSGLGIDAASNTFFDGTTGIYIAGPTPTHPPPPPTPPPPPRPPAPPPPPSAYTSYLQASGQDYKCVTPPNGGNAIGCCVQYGTLKPKYLTDFAACNCCVYDNNQFNPDTCCPVGSFPTGSYPSIQCVQVTWYNAAQQPSGSCPKYTIQPDPYPPNTNQGGNNDQPPTNWYTTPAPLDSMAFYGILDSQGRLTSFGPSVVVENGMSWAGGDRGYSSTPQSVAVDAARGAYYAVGTLFGLRNCTGGTCTNTVRIPAANTNLTLVVPADSVYGTPALNATFPGTYGGDFAMRQVFQSGFLYKLNAWALLITSNDFRWSGACTGDLAKLVGANSKFNTGCGQPNSGVLFGGTKVFSTAVDPSDGGVFIVGHTIFNPSFALPAGLTVGNVTFGTGSSAISLAIQPLRGSYVDSVYPVNTGQSWVAKVSSAGVPMWAQTIGPSKPDANGQAAPVVNAGLAGFLYTGFATANGTSGASGRRHLLDEGDYDFISSAPGSAPVVAYFGILPSPGGGVLTASLRLGGYTAATFIPAAQMAFIAGVAGVLNCSAAAVSITSITDASARRHLTAGTGAVVVTFTVQAPTAASASALAGSLQTVTSNGALTTALQAALPQFTGVSVVSATGAAAPGASSGAGALKRVNFPALAALAAAAALTL